MKIKYGYTERYTAWREMFYIGFTPEDEADYCFTIIFFAREWNWFIWKKDTK